jgi:TPP-dependent pyruvate/acetoin dehydrogenase alpha subunit
MDEIQFYRELYRIRRFEETVLEQFPSGVFAGTTHTCLGQEANAVGVLACMQEQDVVFSNHRGHGHFLAYGGDMQALFAELMGKTTGICGGRGGSQHLHWRNFYSNGVQGGIVPVATGIALAERYQGNDSVVFAFLGDGTLGEGVVYEALNMASLWGAPVLYILENNRIAQTTPVELTLAGDMTARFTAFNIPSLEMDTSDVKLIFDSAAMLVDQVRRARQPRALILNTYRFGPHSKGDDTRPEEDLERIRARYDPLDIQAGRLDLELRRDVETRVDREVRAAFEQALNDPYPEADSLWK